MNMHDRMSDEIETLEIKVSTLQGVIRQISRERDAARAELASLKADAELARAAIALAEHEVNEHDYSHTIAASLREAYRAAKAARENKG